MPNKKRCLGCHKNKPIEARGLCNACYRAQRRLAQRQYLASGPVDQATGHGALGKLFKLMKECKVTNQARRAILREFLPFTGLPPVMQEAQLEALDKTEEDYDTDRNNNQ